MKNRHFKSFLFQCLYHRPNIKHKSKRKDNITQSTDTTSNSSIDEDRIHSSVSSSSSCARDWRSPTLLPALVPGGRQNYFTCLHVDQDVIVSVNCFISFSKKFKISIISHAIVGRRLFRHSSIRDT